MLRYLIFEHHHFFFHFGYKKSLYGIVDLGAALTEIKIQKRSIL